MWHTKWMTEKCLEGSQVVLSMAAQSISPETTLNVLFSTYTYDSVGQTIFHKYYFFCPKCSELEGVASESQKVVVDRSCTFKRKKITVRHYVLSDMLPNHTKSPFEQKTISSWLKKLQAVYIAAQKSTARGHVWHISEHSNRPIEVIKCPIKTQNLIL
jgi:hypothetical protein